MSMQPHRIESAMQERLLDYYTAIEEASSQMLRAARREDWDAVVRCEGVCVVLIEQLRYKARSEDLPREDRAEVVLLPAEWVRGALKEHHWRTLVTARAIENTIYIAAADHVPPIGVGNSMIVDPFGVEIATLGDETGIAVAEISRARLEHVRQVNPALALRRFRVTPA